MFLFLLTINNSGSTAFSQFVETSPHVYLPTFGNHEGQMMPGAMEHMWMNRWDPEQDFNWPAIREVWEARLAESGKSIFLEGSPPNIVRAHAIDAAFPGSKFIIYLGDPYAFCGSCWFRYKIMTEKHEALRELARHWVERATFQSMNARTLQDSIALTHQSFTADPAAARDQLLAFAPELETLDAEPVVKVKGRVAKIEDRSAINVGFLGRDGIETVNQAFAQATDIIQEFGFRLIDPDEADRIAEHPDIGPKLRARRLFMTATRQIVKRRRGALRKTINRFGRFAELEDAQIKELRVTAKLGRFGRLLSLMKSHI